MYMNKTKIKYRSAKKSEKWRC